MSACNSAHVVSMAVRTRRNGPMQEVRSALVRKNGGLEGDLPVNRRRGVTLLSQQQWEEVLRDLGVELPWHTRRANLLVAGMNLARLIGHTIRIGEVEVAILGETDPCANMDRMHPGLRQALNRACHGGVHGQVLGSGEIRVGDKICVVERAVAGE